MRPRRLAMATTSASAIPVRNPRWFRRGPAFAVAVNSCEFFQEIYDFGP